MLMLSSCTTALKSLGQLGEDSSSLYFAITGDDANTKITNKLEELLVAIENQDAVTVNSLFSENAKGSEAEFESSIEELIKYYQGSHQSIKMPNGGAGSSRSRDEAGEQMKYECSFDVTTSECVYRIALSWIAKDTVDIKNVGISSLYIINVEDDINLSSAYNGDAKETPGINVGVQNTWPDNLSYFDE